MAAAKVNSKNIWENRCVHHWIDDKKVHWCECRDYYYPTPGVRCRFEEDGRLAREICKFYNESYIEKIAHDQFKITLNNKAIDHTFTNLELVALCDLITKFLNNKDKK